MPTIYSRKAGLTWCAPPAEEASAQAQHLPDRAAEEMMPAFVIRKMEDGTLDLVMLHIPEEEVEERFEIDLGALPEQHPHGRVA
jgi:hypothetical protein